MNPSKVDSSAILSPEGDVSVPLMMGVETTALPPLLVTFAPFHVEAAMKRSVFANNEPVPIQLQNPLVRQNYLPAPPKAGSTGNDAVTTWKSG